MGSAIKVKTEFSNDLIVQNAMVVYPVDNTVREMTRQIINLQEDGVRTALVKMGWTPPKEFKITHALIANSTPEYFNTATAPDWLCKGGREGSTGDMRWFWNDHVLVLKVGQYIDTDFRRIERVA